MFLITKYWSWYFSLFFSHSVLKYSTMLSGTGLLTPCLWCLQLSILWQGLLFFHSGKRVKSIDAIWCITGIICKYIMCTYLYCRLIHCTWVYPLERFAPFFGYYFFNVMLLVLQILHLYWAFLISQMVYKLICGKVCLQGSLCVITFWEKNKYLKTM